MSTTYYVDLIEIAINVCILTLAVTLAWQHRR
jgi:hypothetical protein